MLVMERTSKDWSALHHINKILFPTCFQYLSSPQAPAHIPQRYLQPGSFFCWMECTQVSATLRSLLGFLQLELGKLGAHKIYC